jgi:PAS domain S-box-containing protein
MEGRQAFVKNHRLSVVMPPSQRESTELPAAHAAPRGAELRIQMLGGFRATFASGRSVVLPNRKDQALLCYLALHPDQPQSREKLANLLWSKSEYESARHSLRQALTSLRRAQIGEEVIATDRNYVVARGAAIHSDVAQFLSLADTERDAISDSTLNVYAGTLLEGFTTEEGPFEEWLLEQRDRLRDLAVGSLEARSESHRLSGRYEKAVECQRRLMLIDPYNERALRGAMRLLVQTGRDLEALRSYQEFTELLQRDLGIRPQVETRDLYLGIVKGRLGRDTDNGDGDSPSPINLVDAFRSLDGFVLWDSADRFVLCNDQFREIFSPAADLLMPGTPWQEIMWTCIERGRFPDAAASADKYFRLRAKRRRSGKGEAPDMRLNDGRCYRLTHRRTDNGGLIVLFTETTERASREREMRRNHQRFQALSGAMPYGIEEVDPDGEVIYCNAALAKMLGYEPAELAGKRQSSFMTRPWIDVAAAWKPARGHNGPGLRLAVQYIAKSGQRVDAAVHWSAVRDDLGRIIAYVGLVTPLKTNERGQT